MGRLTKKAAEQLRAHLASLPHDTLVDLVLEEAARRPELKDRLLIEAAKSGVGTDAASFRRSLNSAIFSLGSGRGWPRTHGAWARGVHQAIDRLGGLLEVGEAAAVRGIAEYGLGRVAKAMGQFDDPSGYFSDIVSRLEDLHRQACQTARPDPVALARQLFAAEVDAEWDILVDSVPRYADVLGEAGIAEFRRLAEERWRAVPAVGPGEKDDERYGSRFRITRIMERLAEHAGDVDALVAVKSRDLSMPYDWLQVAEALAAAGRHSDALSWAERGVAAFPGEEDSRLDDFLCAAYQREGRHDDAMRLAWSRFHHKPGLATYRRLAESARQAGIWSTRRSEALALLRERADAVRRRQAPSSTARRAGWRLSTSQPSGASLLVEILLWEGDVESAWAEAERSGCAQHIWLRLAAAREDTHPAEAIPIYEREVEAIIAGKNNAAYTEAARMMDHIQELHHRSGTSNAFEPFVARIRATHRAKRNLMKLLDESGW